MEPFVRARATAEIERLPEESLVHAGSDTARQPPKASSTPRDLSLDVARMFAAVMILIHHSASYYTGAGGPPVFGRELWMFFGQLALWGRVPFFFFLAGYFAAHSFGKPGNEPRQYIKKRFAVLLPPYLFWNLVCMALISIAVISGYQLVDNARLDLPAIIMRTTGLGLHPANNSLWFIRDLLICTCFAPLLYRLGPWILIPCIGITIAPDIPQDLWEQGCPKPSSLGYFGIGMLLYLFPRGTLTKLFPRPGPAVLLILAVGLTFAIADFPRPHLSGVALGAMGILLSARFTSENLPKLATWLSENSGASFLIFAGNAPYLAIAKHLYIKHQFAIPMLYYFAVLTVIFFVLAMIFYLMVKRWTPNLLWLVSGGR